ncbi:MAG: hypothetical protein AB8H80_19775 [Planctomycetota bacterium]
MRSTTRIVAALCLSGLLGAQGATKQESAQAVFDRLSTTLAKQTNVYQAALKKVRGSEAYKKARADRDNAAIRELTSGIARPDLAAMGKEAMAAAESYKGDDRALLLSWAVANSRDNDIIRDGIKVLRENHIKSPALTPLLEQAMSISRPLGKEDSLAFLSDVIENSPHQMPRAWSLYWKATMMARGRNVAAEVKEEADELLAKAEKLAEGHWLADKIAGPRFKEERLQIGMVAPNIAGEDIDGVKFELADYRGKVVVLDFWGFW